MLVLLIGIFLIFYCFCFFHEKNNFRFNPFECQTGCNHTLSKNTCQHSPTTTTTSFTDPEQQEMTLKYADQFTIIQSYQKDDLYRSKLRLKLKTFFSYILKPNRLLTLTNELNLIADCLYYFLTTISTRQTIGQEYCNLILYDDIQRTIPSKLKRILLITIKIILPYILYKFKFENFLSSTLHLANFKFYSFLFDLFKIAFYYANNLNTIRFFLDSNRNFFKFENYLTNVNYLHITNLPANATGNSPTKLNLLALSLFVPLVYNMVMDVKKINFYLKNVLLARSDDDGSSHDDETTHFANKNNLVISIKANRKCLLCLDFIKNATLTTCGHCFCWYCINDYASKTLYFDKNRNKSIAKCPICRDLFQINKLVFLFNYWNKANTKFSELIDWGKIKQFRQVFSGCVRFGDFFGVNFFSKNLFFFPTFKAQFNNPRWVQTLSCGWLWKHWRNKTKMLFIQHRILLNFQVNMF